MKVFSLKWRGVNGPHKMCLSQPQVARESASSFESASPMQCSWSKVVPGASQLLLQTEPVVGEQLSMEWKWMERCETAFHNLKEMITSEQILTHYDPTLPRRLPCDACPVGIGAVLSHVTKDWDTHCFCFQDTHKTEKDLSPLDRSLAVKIYLPSTKERFSNYSSQASALCIIHGWLRPPIRIQEY